MWLQFVQIWPKSWTGLDLKTLEANSFRIYHKYALGPPTITPDDSFTLSSLPDFVSIAHDLADSHSKASWWSSFGSSCLKTVKNATNNYFAPFLNASIFLLMAWYYNGSSIKSFADINKLVCDVIMKISMLLTLERLLLLLARCNGWINTMLQMHPPFLTTLKTQISHDSVTTVH